MTLLRDAVGDATFSFVVGKGGVGKTTAAGALALELADAGEATHLISTDPAHSLADLFRQPLTGGSVAAACSPHLQLEEFDAAAAAAAWTAHATASASALIEAGTYLDREDVAGFARQALPGLDEMMAVLRLADLAAGAVRVVVDTAPTGHALRLLDAGSTHAGLARALRAMADKAVAVASGFARHSVRLGGESIIDELEHYVETFETLLGGAAFIVAARADDVVVAETGRVIVALRQRRLRVATTVWVGAAARLDAPCIAVPWLPDPGGCDGLRAWLLAQRPCGSAASAPTHSDAAGPSPVRNAGSAGGSPQPALSWLESAAPRLLLFAGKGGVGKSTCAAAAAIALAATRPVLLCGADPAGSLDDVFGSNVTAAGRAAPGVRILQVDAVAQFERLRGEYRADVMEALERIGLSTAAVLDRRVIDAVLDLAPPGIDEFAALAALIDAADADETVVIDAAPTGHFLRLLTMPALALDWTRQLMRLIVKYRVAGRTGSAAETLLRTARELRALDERLHDSTRTGVVVVTTDQPMVRAETERLLSVLADAGVPVMAVLDNMNGGTEPPPGADRYTVVLASRRGPAPIGAHALLDFAEQWKVER